MRKELQMCMFGGVDAGHVVPRCSAVIGPLEKRHEKEGRARKAAQRSLISWEGLGGELVEKARNMRFNMNHLERLQRGMKGVGRGEALEPRRLGRAAQTVEALASHQALPFIL